VTALILFVCLFCGLIYVLRRILKNHRPSARVGFRKESSISSRRVPSHNIVDI